jgi:hypothetical protein
MSGDGFTPDNSWRPVDPRLLCPIALFVLTAVESYFSAHLNDLVEATQIRGRIHVLLDRLLTVQNWHEVLLGRGKNRDTSSTR